MMIRAMISPYRHPEDMADDAELYHSELVEKICELDDDLMMQYLEVRSHPLRDEEGSS